VLGLSHLHQVRAPHTSPPIAPAPCTVAMACTPCQPARLVTPWAVCPQALVAGAAAGLG
jgi:hypothetical protein